jgi:cell wall-associated NlpC family hydrolase
VGRQQSVARAHRRTSRLALAAVLGAVTLAGPAPHASAAADPGVYPSASQVAASRARVTSRAAQVGRIEARLAAATARSAALATQVAVAVEAYNGARYRLQSAVAGAKRAQRRAAAARTGVATSRREVGAFAAAAYRTGGDLGGLSAFLSAQGPRDLISRAAALTAIGQHRDNMLDALRSAQAVSGVMAHRADVMVAERRRATLAVARAKQSAQSALAGQRQAVGEISAERASLVRSLAAARHTSVRLERARQAGLEAARQAAARRAAAARAARAARVAAAAAAAAASARAAAAAQAAAESRRQAEEAAAGQARAPADERGGGSSGGGSGDTGGGSGGGSGDPAPAPPASSGSSGATASGASAAIAFARDQIGKPYVWAADGPGSFDCSGLTMRAWQQGGVSLPHYSVAQYQQSQPVALGDLRPGDLVFFASNKSDYRSIYHVALYVGDGQMIEAPFTGEDVRVSSIWRDSLFGAARP